MEKNNQMLIRNGIVALVLIAAVMLTPLWAQQKEQVKVGGVLATLKVGQAVNVKEVGDRYLLSVIDGELKLPQPHMILEIGSDFVSVQDFTQLNETRIPLTSIKSIVHFKGFERK